MTQHSGGVTVETLDGPAAGAGEIISPAAEAKRGPGRPAGRRGNPAAPAATAQTADNEDAMRGGDPAYDQSVTRTGAEVEEIVEHGRKVYRRADMAHSPTGKARARIVVRSYIVKGTHTDYVLRGTKSVPVKKTIERRIDGVPGQPMAIREFLLLPEVREHGSSVDFNCVAIPIPGTERDAGEPGYNSRHVQPGTMQTAAVPVG